MKVKGVLRQVDKMGRVVVPKEFRNQLGVKNDEDSFEIFMEDDKIILKKYQPTCIFCDNFASGVEYEGYSVCENCIEKLKKLIDEKNLIEEKSKEQ